MRRELPAMAVATSQNTHIPPRGRWHRYALKKAGTVSVVGLVGLLYPYSHIDLKIRNQGNYVEDLQHSSLQPRGHSSLMV